MTRRQRAYRVTVQNRQRKIKAPAALLRGAALGALEYTQAAPGMVSIVVVGDAAMRALNLAWAGVEDTTDVLSFDLSGQASGDGATAEVIVNGGVAAVEAARRGKEPLEELLLYVVHGVLHIGGYRDKTAGERRKMRRAEAAVLRQLGNQRDGGVKCR